jgi:hypothetical protein
VEKQEVHMQVDVVATHFDDIVCRLINEYLNQHGAAHDDDDKDLQFSIYIQSTTAKAQFLYAQQLHLI